MAGLSPSEISPEKTRKSLIKVTSPVKVDLTYGIKKVQRLFWCGSL